mgnify:CR=1 FL=1
MTSQQAILSPLTILEQLKKNGVTHVVYLPDSETNHLFLAMEDDPDIDVIPVGREAETMAIAAGLVVGGKKLWQGVRGSGSYLSHNDTRAHFGIGKSLELDSVDVIWPSGFHQRIWNVPANKLLVVRENETHAVCEHGSNPYKKFAVQN